VKLHCFLREYHVIIEFSRVEGYHFCIENLRKNVRNRWCSFRRQNDMQMFQKCFKIYAKSIPKCSGKAMSNDIGKMVDGQAGRESPGPAGLKYRQHQKSIHPTIHVISSSQSINQSIKQPLARSIGQSINQSSTDQSITQSID